MHQNAKTCPRRAFDGCRGGDTCRQCPAPADIEVAPRRLRDGRIGERWLVALIILSAAAGGYIGHGILEREAHAYAMARN